MLTIISATFFLRQSADHLYHQPRVSRPSHFFSHASIFSASENLPELSIIFIHLHFFSHNIFCFLIFFSERFSPSSSPCFYQISTEEFHPHRQDRSEKCRECAVKILRSLVENTSDLSAALCLTRNDPGRCHHFYVAIAMEIH